MTVDQIIKYVTETPNNTNPNVLYSLIQQGIATNWQPDPDPSAVRFLSFVYDAQAWQPLDIKELPLSFEVPLETYVNKTFYNDGISIVSGTYVIIDQQDRSEGSRAYGLLNMMTVGYDITAKTSSGYDLNAEVVEIPNSGYFCVGISYTDPVDMGSLFENKCTIKGSNYIYTTVTLKYCGATFVFNLGREEQK